MSRFRDLSPRAERTESIVASISVEDEIIQSILRKRQQRLSPTAVRRLQAAASIASSATSDDVVPNCDATLETPTSFGTTSAGTTLKTPYNLLKRLSRVDSNARPADEIPRLECVSVAPDDAPSRASHTTESIQEAADFLERKVTPGDVSLTSIARTMAKESRTPEDLFNQEGTLERSRRDSCDTKRPNRTLFTPTRGMVPATPDGHPRSREVAEGYISPPQSRQTSPDPVTTDKLSISSPARPSATPIRRSASLDGSPSPTATRRLAPTFESMSRTPIRGSPQAEIANLQTSSPRSRLTRTLLEIQSELAESREGIESIESRLGVLEQHSSLDREQLQKHFEDCIRDMALDMDESDTSVDEGSESIMPPAVVEGVPAASVQGTADEPGGTTFRVPLSMPAITFAVLGALVAEWLVNVLADELGRRRSWTAS